MAFVRALGVYHWESSTPDLKENGTKKGLSVDKIVFSMLLLAAHPVIQAWIFEGITAVTNGPPIEEWDYKKLFPRLKRCRAALFETLRLYPPTMALQNWIS
ncbi:hypothetical protein Hte_010451 [Hypoxylon texense]